MKFYNICDTKRFFEVLAQCTGVVELVSDEGLHITLNDDCAERNLAMLAQTYVRGSIHCMELAFQKSGDAVMMCNYVMNMKAS